MNKNNLYILSIILILIGFSSCNKKDASSLAGDWDYIYLNEQEKSEGETQVWTFDGGSNVDVKFHKQDTTITYSGHYTYYYKSMSKDIMDLYDINQYIDGKYKVHKFKNGQLVIERLEYPNGNENGAFLWKEFTKK